MIKPFLFLSTLLLGSVSASYAQSFPVPKHVAGTFDRVVWQGPDGFARQIANTSRLYYEPFPGGGATARSTTTALTVAGDLDLHRTRNMTAQALARAGRIAARASGPGLLLLAGLDLADVVFQDDEWKAPGQQQAFQSSCWSAFNNPHVCGDESVIRAEALRIWPDFGPITGFSYDPTWGDGLGRILINFGVHMAMGFTPAGTQCSSGFVASYTGCELPDLAPASDQQIEDAIYVDLVSRGLGSELARRLIDAGYVPDMSPLEVSGPSSIDGPTTTTTSTGPSGTTTTTSSVRYDLGYSGDTVSVTPTTTTTTTTPDGQTITDTTTTSPGGGGTTVEVPDQTALCEEYPHISACQELGNPEEDFELDREERDIDWEQEMSASGSCPSPRTIQIPFRTLEISFQPLCDFAVMVRPLIILLAWFSAGIWLFYFMRARP